MYMQSRDSSSYVPEFCEYCGRELTDSEILYNDVICDDCYDDLYDDGYERVNY